MENQTVEIRAFFQWASVSKEIAYAFCEGYMKSICTTSDRKEKIRMINNYHLRGITFEELEKEVGDKCSA